VSRKESIFWGVMVVVSFVAIFLYIYFTRTVKVKVPEEEPKKTLYEQILNDNNTILFRNAHTKYEDINSKVLYRTKEDNTNIYYFAGNAQNNWVEFANMYFRIIRTDKSNNIRLLYSGTEVNSKNAYIGESIYSSNGSVNYITSNVVSVLNNWYESNFNTYEDYFAKNSVYCSKVNSNNVSLDCTEANSYLSSSYPASLITLEELLFIGSRVNEVGNTWVNYNSQRESIMSNGTWVTMSYSRNNTIENVFVVGSNGLDYPVIKEDSPVNSYLIRPVITLKSCVNYESGDGSFTSPYKISINENCKVSE